MENGGDPDGRTKNVEKRVGSVDDNPEHLENRKEAKREARGAQDSNKNSRWGVSHLSRLTRGFRNKYH